MKISITIWGTAALLCLPVLLAGCGKKGPPVPPRQQPPPPVQELSHRIDDGRLTLSWRVPDAEAGSEYDEPAGFRILRARQPHEQACPRCPMTYDAVAELPLKKSGRSADGALSKVNYSETLEQGYFYAYKVMAVSKRGVASKASRQIYFDYPESPER